jgi:hypothetical protein
MEEVLRLALGKFLFSIGEATFWILIIVAVGVMVERIYKKIVLFLTEDIKPEKPKEEREEE